MRRLRLRSLARRAAKLGLRVFPFSLGYALLSAGFRLYRLRGSERLARVGEAKSAASPLAALLWLDRIAADVPGSAFDACLRLSADSDDDRLADVFSILLASRRLRSLALYWNEERLLEDLPLWQARGDRATVSVWSSVREPLSPPEAATLRDFLVAAHEPLAVPVAARREAETLLKRLAGGACALVLNPLDGARWIAEELARARPDIRLFDLRAMASTPIAGCVPLGGLGLSLHERLALVAAGDVYVGCFDELGAAVLVAGRRAVLLGGDTPVPEAASRESVLWLPEPSDRQTLLAFVLEFLAGQPGPTAG